MRIECYDLHIYCDHPEHEARTVAAGDLVRPGEFTGRDRRDATQEARRAGWIRVGKQDICPRCRTERSHATD